MAGGYAMKAIIYPKKLSGTLKSIPSKSFAHRALICAALAKGNSDITIDRSSVDIDATAAALSALGAEIHRDGEILLVKPVQKAEGIPIVDAVESGSTLRFLLPVASALYDSVYFTGSGRLPERPLGPLLDTMQKNGCEFSTDRLPFTTRSRLSGTSYRLPGDVSSQFVSGLLMTAPLLNDEVNITLTSPLESADYVAITIDVMKRFGVSVEETKTGYRVQRGQLYCGCAYEVEGDWSNAAFFLVAGVLGDSVSLSGLKADSVQGDRGILDVLEQYGAEISAGDPILCFPKERNPIQVDLSKMPDSLPVLAVLAASVKGISRFTNGKRLRLKESDRLSTVRQMITDLGGHAEEIGDELRVYGTGTLQGGRTSSFGDHRLAMAAAVAASICVNPVEIEDAMAVKKSYPDFYRDYEKLGGTVDVQ